MTLWERRFKERLCRFQELAAKEKSNAAILIRYAAHLGL